MQRLATLLVCFLILTQSIKAQESEAYLSAGYGFSFGSYSGFNQFVKRYNATRTWLDKPMPTASQLNGFSVGFGYVFSNFLIDFQWTGRHNTFQASGPQQSNGIYGYRQMKYRMNTFNIGFGVGQGEPPVQIFAGASLDFGFNHAFTRTWNDGDEVPSFEDTNDSKTSLASTVFVDLRFGKKVSIGIKPYYQFHFFKHDFNWENQMINGYSGYFYDDDPKFASLASNFGLEAKLFLNFY